MTWSKAKTATILGAAILLTAGAGLAVVKYGCSQTVRDNNQAVQEKRAAEQAGGPTNVAQNPNATKQTDEQTALREQQNQTGK